MRKQFLVIWLLFTAAAGSSQVAMTLEVPPTGVLMKKQLWNMALVYTGQYFTNVRVSLTLSDPANNQPVLTATTSAVTINRGATQLQSSSFVLIDYNYLSPQVTDHDPDGYLPVGNYEACYTVTQDNSHALAPLAQDCITFEVQPLSPPMLNFPSDGDTLITTIPQFTWLPPSPANLFNNLSYRFNLVEVQQGQNPLDAIQQNLPVYTNMNCPDIFLNYPASGLSLDTGKQYAWQIVAQSNMQPTTQSEVWTFRIKGGQPAPLVFKGAYLQLGTASEKRGVYTAEEGVLAIQYYSFDKEHNTNITFLNSAHKAVGIQNADLKYGDNYFIYNLSGAFKSNQLYYVQLSDVHNNKYTAAFRISPKK